MKYKLFEEYVEEENDGHPGFYETEEEIHAWLKENDSNYNENKYIINSDWSVDVKGNVGIWQKYLNYILVNFNYVNGDFGCFDNKLTTLKGSPNYVGVHFSCWNNKLTTLKEAPNHVGEEFNCKSNDLITFEYAPDYVGRHFVCFDNYDLVTLAHKSSIKGNFMPNSIKGSLKERWNRYRNYLNTLDEDDKKSSLQWLYDVDEDFRELIVKYAAYNDIDLPGVDLSIAKDASKHKDSGLF